MLQERSKPAEAGSDSAPRMTKAELERKRAKARAYYKKNRKAILEKQKAANRAKGKAKGVPRNVYSLATRLRRLVGERLKAGEELNDLYIAAFLLTEEVLKDG